MATPGFQLGLVIRLVQYIRGQGRGEGIMPNLTIAGFYAVIVGALAMVLNLPVLAASLELGLTGIVAAIFIAVTEFLAFVAGSLFVDVAEWVISTVEG